jgi:TorA maturation chaperone TorD
VELFRALGALSEPPSPELQRIADALGLGTPAAPAVHSDLFLFQLYPYASVYLSAEGMLGGEARDRIAGFWRALGVVPPAEPDHLAVMLALHARIGELEAADPHRSEAWRHARRAHLWEHLLSWLPGFLEKLRQLADPFYTRWASLLGETLREEAERLGGPERLALHLREAPGLADPERDGLEPFLQSLLTPVRSGMILARADLARAADQLGLGLRLGERRWVLRALFEQAAAPVLQWLAGEASHWACRHTPELHLAATPAAFWRSRAETTAQLLLRLRAGIEAKAAG